MQHVVCNLCGRDDTVLRYPSTLPDETPSTSVDAFRCTGTGYGRHHSIVECRHCGLMYTNPRWNDEQLLDSYVAVEDSIYVEEREGRVLTFERHLRPLERLQSPPGKLLDVGAHTGVFVEIAARNGWDAWGVEPSRWAVEQARQRGLNMVEGALGTAQLADESFDVVTMWDVIEHLHDPFAALKHASRLLRPGGLLVVHTMDIDSRFARVMGRRWPWLMEMHIYYFSRRTLSAMLEAAGFRVTRAVPQGRYSSLGYLATRIGGISPRIGRITGTLVNALRLDRVAVPVNLGDLITAYAIKT